MGEFKPKLFKTAKRHISCLCDESDWTDAGQGWEGKAGQWALQGWNGKLCVVVLRRPLTSEKVAQDDSGQLMLSSSTPSEEGQRRSAATSTPVSSSAPAPRFSVSVSFTGIGRMPRAPSMKLKNQWGWGGYTTHDPHRCQLAARAVALIHNWWSLLVRLTHPEARREAITSRPWLMTCVGRKTEYAGQTTVTLTGLHGHFAPARAALTRVSALLQGWVAETAEQLTQPSVWHPVGDHLKRILAGIRSPPSQPLLKKTMRMGSADCGF